ncbi:Uncharacterised protein [Burkholderia pseudomallei]|nr:Uncharacterised protein [Burkholderia pseudomallei]
MRKALKIVIVALEVLLACEVLLWLAFGKPPLQWHAWYLIVVPIGLFVFWPSKKKE